jgi:DNA-directed RNA polymerase subunit RPC12/RpoP
MKRFSKRVRCGVCGKPHYAQPVEGGQGRRQAVCPRCGAVLEVAAIDLMIGRVAPGKTVART